MSRNPTAAELAAIKAAEAQANQARLVAKNKEAARAHLLQIQLLLARQPIPAKK